METKNQELYVPYSLVPAWLPCFCMLTKNIILRTQALSTFPVRHYVNHRTMRIADKAKGFVFTFAGDEQASVSADVKRIRNRHNFISFS